MAPQPCFRPVRATTETGTSSPPSLRLTGGTRSYAAAVINERLTELGITLPHARTAVGMAEWPLDIAVEIEMTSRVRD